MSPHLFLFVAHSFSSILRDEIGGGRLLEFKICWRAGGILHLLFSDDSLLFFKASVEQTMVVKHAIMKYEKGADSWSVLRSVITACSAKIVMNQHRR